MARPTLLAADSSTSSSPPGRCLASRCTRRRRAKSTCLPSRPSPRAHQGESESPSTGRSPRSRASDSCRPSCRVRRGWRRSHPSRARGLLGGDVHHASAVRVRYHGEVVSARGRAREVEGVVAQLTSSALKNEGTLTRSHRADRLHNDGGDQAGLLIVGRPASHRGQRLGQRDGARKPVGVETQTSRRQRGSPADQGRGQPGDLRVHVRRRARHHTAGGRERDHYSLNTPPDWQYTVRPERGLLDGREHAARTVPVGAASARWEGRSGRRRGATAAARGRQAGQRAGGRRPQQHRRRQLRVGCGRREDRRDGHAGSDRRRPTRRVPFTKFEIELDTGP